MWYEGLLQFSVWERVVALLVLTHLSIIGVTVYLHRYSSHRALELHPWVQHVFRFWMWFATTINTKEFTAIHRKHHAVTETADDPHSPKFYGLKELLFNGIEHYTTAARDQEILDRYGQGTPDDWIENNLYGPHSNLGVAILLVLYVVLFGPLGLTMWAIQMIWIPFLALGVINGVGHTYGYRNFECPDAATNVAPWGILIGGEELHNNHHAYPNSAKLSRQWWEFDIGWLYIKTLSLLGLAKVRSTGPVVQQLTEKRPVDEDMVWATLNDRFQLLARYSDDVIAPQTKLEESKLATLNIVGNQARRLLSRETTLLDSQGVKDIEQIVAVSPMLKLVYEKRMQLQAVWQKRKEGMAVMVEALRVWCEEAEKSGVQALQEFATTVQSLTIPTAKSTS